MCCTYSTGLSQRSLSVCTKLDAKCKKTSNGRRYIADFWQRWTYEDCSSHCYWRWMVTGQCGKLVTIAGRLIKLDFHRSSFLIASSWHPHQHVRHPHLNPRGFLTNMPNTATSSRGCYDDVVRLPRSACHALTWLVGQRSAAVYSAAHSSVCRAISWIPWARHA